MVLCLSRSSIDIQMIQFKSTTHLFFNFLCYYKAIFLTLIYFYRKNKAALVYFTRNFFILDRINYIINLSYKAIGFYGF
jgi:hypothetical protein